MESVGAMLHIFEIKGSQNHRYCAWKEQNDFVKEDNT
jgi:hypothetical protein